MSVGLLIVDMHLPESRSLKSKRRILKGLVDRLRNRHNISIAEIDHQDLWQRTKVALAVVSNDSRYSNRILTKVIDQINSEPRVQVIDYNLTLL